MNSANGLLTSSFIYGFLVIAAVSMTGTQGGCAEEDNPHSMDLAKQVAALYPLAARTKITVTKATEKEYVFNIMYPTLSTFKGESEPTGLIRAMIKKLLADGQQPHNQDKSIDITVWGSYIDPGYIGESGARSTARESNIFRAEYGGYADVIGYGECASVSIPGCR